MKDDDGSAAMKQQAEQVEALSERGVQAFLQCPRWQVLTALAGRMALLAELLRERGLLRLFVHA